MRNVWLLTFVVQLYGLSIGLFQVATPQACQQLNMTSDNLGLTCTLAAVGYVTGCLFLGQLFRRVRGKYVLIGGVALTILSGILMARASTVPEACAAQLLSGIGQGAFWPFASAWMLDFQSEGASKTRILRHYNLAWTSGTAIGLFAGGWICGSGWIFETFYISCGALVLVLALACKPNSTSAQRVGGEITGTGHVLVRTPGALFAAAITLNLIALGLRTTIQNNYTELNHALGFGAERMGMIPACIIVGQLCAFGFGKVYEPFLGMRRTYFFIAVCLSGIAVTFAYVQSLPVLMAATFIFGLVLAMSFQTGILAATTFFKSPRTGTTVHEAVIGSGNGAPILSGLLIQFGKNAGWEELDALRAPFIVFALLALVLFALQQGLITSQHAARVLLRPAPPADSFPKVDQVAPLST